MDYTQFLKAERDPLNEMKFILIHKEDPSKNKEILQELKELPG